MWESTDQDVQGNASDPGGHVDVTNVVCGPSFGAGFGLEGYVLKIGEIQVGGASFDTALNVAAWHEESDGQYNVKYRILHQWLNSQTQQLEDGMSDVYTVENPDDADQQYPSVTAHLAALIPMKGIEPKSIEAELNFYLIIDIAYEKVLPAEYVIIEHRRYYYEVTEDDDDGIDYTYLDDDGPFLLPMPGDFVGDCQKPDIAYFSFPDDTGHEGTGNNQVDCVFAGYEFESDISSPYWEDFYGIVYADFSQTEWNDDYDMSQWYEGSGHCGFQTSIAESEEVYPMHPRIDAGLDFTYDGITVVTTVWQVYDYGDTGDFDWAMHSEDISGWPSVGPVASQIESPNAGNINAFYPYVDFDPIEKYFLGDELDTYAHFVYTREQSAYNGYYALYYSNSHMADNGNEAEIFSESSYNSGYPAIAMYADQVINDGNEDFDIVFTSNHEGGDYLVYSQEVELLNEACTSIEVDASSEVQISNSSNESVWQSPFFATISGTYYYGPVNAIFYWKSEEACWTHEGSTDQVYGDFEIQ